LYSDAFQRIVILEVLFPSRAERKEEKSTAIHSSVCVTSRSKYSSCQYHWESASNVGERREREKESRRGGGDVCEVVFGEKVMMKKERDLAERESGVYVVSTKRVDIT